ncbi:MAG: hypothetical protein R2795_01290 [Saprospiraceae bacterium]
MMNNEEDTLLDDFSKESAEDTPEENLAARRMMRYFLYALGILVGTALSVWIMRHAVSPPESYTDFVHQRNTLLGMGAAGVWLFSTLGLLSGVRMARSETVSGYQAAVFVVLAVGCLGALWVFVTYYLN